MAVLYSNSSGWFICHETFIRAVYSNTKVNESYTSYGFNPVLFEILEPFKNHKRKYDESNSEIKLIKKALESLRDHFAADNLHNKDESNNNSEAKLTANSFYNGSCNCYPKHSFLGGNTCEESIVSIVQNENYLFPRKCSFYSHDIKEVNYHLREKSYHFVLMDPPWWNKYIRRKRKADSSSGYAMLYDKDLLSIPINDLLHEDGIIGIWCTSAPSHINAILTLLFPAWNVEYITQWFWLKVTKVGEPVCAFSQFPGKQPYERIIFGKKKGKCRNYPDPENNKVIISVPSAIHSHKPPICDIMKKYLPENADCLELFARYLLPHWTSYGNEVIKMQHISLYKETNNS